MEEFKMDVLVNVGFFPDITSTQMIDRVTRDEKIHYHLDTCKNDIRERVLKHIKELEDAKFIEKKWPDKALNSPLLMTPKGQEEWSRQMFL